MMVISIHSPAAQARWRTDSMREEFEEDHPEESTTTGGGFFVSIAGWLGFDVEGEKTIRWGATTGFMTACQQAGIKAITYCAEKKADCDIEMDPDRHCN